MRTEELQIREHPGNERGSTTMTGIRLPISFSLSLFTTAALFWFLGMLISGGPVKDLTPIIPDIDYLSTLIPDPEVVKIRHPKPPIEKPEPLPSVPTVMVPKTDLTPGVDPSELDPTGEGFGPGEGVLPPGRDLDFALRGSSDRSAMPQVRIEPDYPPQAKERGIEGWITFRFTVAKDGSVKDVVIVDAKPERIWDRNTIRAVSTWKYQPKIKDGKPVEQVGLMATYRFELDR